MRKIVALITFLVFVSLFAKGEKLLTVLFTNDSHGMAWSYDAPGNPGIGGLAARKTLIDQIREEVAAKGGNVLLVSSGDITLGDPRSNICLNKPMIKGMNLLGYDAMCVGNHEFDFGFDAFMNMKKEAEFDFLSSNIYLNSKPVVESYIQKRFKDGLKVAILGLTTRETEVITSDGLEGKLTLTDPIEEAKMIVPILKKNNDIVIALSHIGMYYTDQTFDGYNSDSFLAKMVPGIDLVVGGHSQQHLKRPIRIGNTRIVQTEGYGKWLGRIDFVITEKGKVKQKKFKLYPINLKKKVVKDGKKSYVLISKKIEENKAVIDMLNGFKCDFPKHVIGQLTVDFSGERDEVRHKETPLGDLVADAMREKGSADFSFFNAGSIRQGLRKGDVRELDVYNVFPFNDTLIIGQMKGAVIHDLMEFFAEKTRGSGGFLQVSGITMKLYRGSALEIKINGKKLDPKKKYTFATNSFLAKGGDGYKIVAKVKGKKNTGYSIPSIISNYIKKRKMIKKPVMGRINIVN